ncbi:MAG: LysM peptidoglycan-binding domain-containing protein [Chthoniobacterales bacterium]
MKIPTFLLKKKPVKKRLRASTARRSMAGDEMDFDEMSEPNMKLSRALLIVLVLHVVAVAGIVAFNTIKSRQGVLPAPPIATTATPKTDNAPSAAAKMDAAASPAPATTSAPVIIAKQGPAGGEVRKAEPVKPSASTAPVNDAGKSYVVAKGDNPVKIAKKLKVSEAELLAANHIDDPRKLQIGQKLIVPASKSSKSKKSED